MFIHIRHGIETDEYVLDMGKGFVTAADVLKRIRKMKNIQHSHLLLADVCNNTIIDEQQKVDNARRYKVLRRPLEHKLTNI